jgi:hypothetical protein
MKWKIEIEAPDEKSAIQYLETLTEVFKVSVKFNEPLHHADFSDKGKKLKCTRDPYPEDSQPPR